MFLSRWFSGESFAGVPGPADDYWYGPGPGTMTAAGISIDAESAQKLSAWYRGKALLMTIVAMLPFPVYRRLPDDGGAEVATDYYLYDVLHDTPNAWQDSFQWRLEKMCQLIDCGNAYDWIVPGPRGFAQQLQPIDPRLVTPTVTPTGYRYAVRDARSGQTTYHTQDEIFHLRGPGGKGILEYARSSLGTALATEQYAASIFSAGALQGGSIEVPGVLDAEAGKRLAQSFVTKVGHWNMPKVLEQGAKFVQNSMTPEDAQMLLSRRFTVDDVARWLGVPRTMLENSDPSFGNAEQFDQNFITYSCGGWLSLFEFAINRQLIANTKLYYAEFTRDAIARGKLIDRWAVHVDAVNAGIKSADEARVKEGLTRRGGAAGELRQPQNITGKPAVAETTSANQPLVSSPNPDTVPARPRRTRAGALADVAPQARAIIIESAARVLRKEIAAVQKAAVKCAADPDEFAIWVTNFYAAHVELITHTLMMDAQSAQSYCAGQAAQLIGERGIAALEIWDTVAYAEGVAGWALERELSA